MWVRLYTEVTVGFLSANFSGFSTCLIKIIELKIKSRAALKPDDKRPFKQLDYTGFYVTVLNVDSQSSQAITKTNVALNYHTSRRFPQCITLTRCLPQCSVSSTPHSCASHIIVCSASRHLLPLLLIVTCKRPPLGGAPVSCVQLIVNCMAFINSWEYSVTLFICRL